MDSSGYIREWKPDRAGDRKLALPEIKRPWKKKKTDVDKIPLYFAS